MKKRNLFLILFSVAIALFIIAFATVYLLVLSTGEKDVPTKAPTSANTEPSGEKNPSELDHPELLTDISETNLHAFTVNGYRYIKGENGYYAEEHPDWPLDQKELSKIVTAITQLQSTYLVEKTDGGPQYGYYASDEPTFSLEDESGGKISVWIGDKCDRDDRYYASSSYADGVYLLSFDKRVLSYDLYSLLTLDSFYFFEEKQMQSLVLKNKHGETVHDAPCEGGEPLGAWAFLGNMDISPSAVQAYQPSAEQLDEWGLASELTAGVEFLNTKGAVTSFTCRLGKAIEVENSYGIKQRMVYVQLDRIVYLTHVTEEGALVLNSLLN